MRHARLPQLDCFRSREITGGRIAVEFRPSARESCTIATRTLPAMLRSIGHGIEPTQEDQSELERDGIVTRVKDGNVN